MGDAGQIHGRIIQLCWPLHVAIRRLCFTGCLAGLVGAVMTANIIITANGGELPETASDIGKTATQDVPIAPELANPKERETWPQFYQRMARSIP